MLVFLILDAGLVAPTVLLSRGSRFQSGLGLGGQIAAVELFKLSGEVRPASRDLKV